MRKHELDMIEERHEAEMVLLRAQVNELRAKAAMWGCLGASLIMVGIALFTQV